MKNRIMENLNITNEDEGKREGRKEKRQGFREYTGRRRIKTKKLNTARKINDLRSGCQKETW